MRHYPTFSIRFLLLIMAVFCAILGALFYLARIPLVVEEWYALFGKPAPANPGGGRGSWLVFLLFTYISPLLLAATMYAMSAIASRFPDRDTGDDSTNPLE